MNGLDKIKELNSKGEEFKRTVAGGGPGYYRSPEPRKITFWEKISIIESIIVQKIWDFIFKIS